MRIAEVIGNVTLSRVHPSMIGGRWVIGVPYSLPALHDDGAPDGDDVVIYDHLGASVGARIGFSEGAEAAAPFSPEKKPVDAFCACLLDTIVVNDRE